MADNFKLLPPDTTAQQLIDLVEQAINVPTKDPTAPADVYAVDHLTSFKMFLDASTRLPVEVTPLAPTATKEEITEVDAQMMNTMAVYMMLGINRIRSINDVVQMSRALTHFIRERRAFLGHPLATGAPSTAGFRFMEPV